MEKKTPGARFRCSASGLPLTRRPAAGWELLRLGPARRYDAVPLEVAAAERQGMGLGSRLAPSAALKWVISVLAFDPRGRFLGD